MHWTKTENHRLIPSKCIITITNHHGDNKADSNYLCYDNASQAVNFMEK